MTNLWRAPSSQPIPPNCLRIAFTAWPWGRELQDIYNHESGYPVAPCGEVYFRDSILLLPGESAEFMDFLTVEHSGQTVMMWGYYALTNTNGHPVAIETRLVDDDVIHPSVEEDDDGFSAEEWFEDFFDEDEEYDEDFDDEEEFDEEDDEFDEYDDDFEEEFELDEV